MAHWRKDTNPGFAISALAATETKAGSGSFSGFEYSEWIILLESAVSFSDLVPASERRRILNHAVGAAARSHSLNPDGLLRHIKTKEAEFLKRPQETYQLRTAISLRANIGSSRYLINGATVSVGAKIPAKAKRDRENLIRRAQHSISGDVPNNYLPVAVTLRARTPEDAGTNALDTIDLLRSIWNLCKNRESAWRMSSGRMKAVNLIFLAPIHSLHKLDGKLATDAWWYDPDYTSPAPLFEDKASFARIKTFTERVRKHLKKSHYAPAWEASALRYGRALDSRDLSNAFLRLWGVLETLTDSINSPASVAIRRAAFLFSDRQRAIAVLTFLADYRNRFVHAGSESTEIEALLFLLKRHVEALMLFHLGFRNQFKSIGEACEFLDLPSSQQAIGRRVRLLKLAQAFVTAP